MAEVLYDEQLVCSDCAMVITNGSRALEDVPERINSVVESLNRVEGHWALTDEFYEFSWQACDGCRSYLGGSRYGAVVLS